MQLYLAAWCTGILLVEVRFVLALQVPSLLLSMYQLLCVIPAN